MPVIELLNLPQEQSEKVLAQLDNKLVNTVLWVKELKVTDFKEVTCHFVSDLRKITNSKITVRISGLYEKPERTEKVLKRLGLNVCNTIQKFYPSMAVDCEVSTLHHTIALWVCVEAQK